MLAPPLLVRTGVNMGYPRGLPDELEYGPVGDGSLPAWTTVRLEGGWFPDAFIGPMASLLRFDSGESRELPTCVEDAWRTMAVVEAFYASGEHGATPIPP
jgi:hypothetical protein